MWYFGAENTSEVRTFAETSDQAAAAAEFVPYRLIILCSLKFAKFRRN